MANQDDYTRYTIRVPSDLYDQVAARAQANGRSVNAEIIARLEQSLSTMPAPVNFNLSPDLRGLRDHLVEIETLIRDELLARKDEEP